VRAQRFGRTVRHEALPGLDQLHRPEEAPGVVGGLAQVDDREAVGFGLHLAREGELIRLQQRQRAGEDRRVAAGQNDRREGRDRPEGCAARDPLVVAGLDVGDLVSEHPGQLARRAHRGQLPREEEDVPCRRGERVEDRLVDDVEVIGVGGRADRERDLGAGAPQDPEHLGVPEQRELRADAAHPLLPVENVALLSGDPALLSGAGRAGAAEGQQNTGPG
jgi:hypothetical protein